MDPIEKIMQLAPKAVSEAERILNRSGSLNAQIAMIELVLNRAYGKPEAALKIETGGRTIEEGAAEMQAIAAGIYQRKILGCEEDDVDAQEEDDGADDE